MSHRKWTSLGLLLLSAAAGAQDLSGGFGNMLFAPLTAVAQGVNGLRPPAVADFDEDGLSDVVLQQAQVQDLALLFGQPGVGLGNLVLIPSGVSTFARVLAADVDGDGHQDLLVVSQAVDVTWLRGHGDGTFDAPQPGGPGPIPFGDMLLADADGDGLADLLTAPQFAHVGFHKGNGAGRFLRPDELCPTYAPTDLMLADLDDDGVLDIALLDMGQVQVLEGLGGGAFAPPQAWSSNAHNGLDAADMDLDGTLDLVHGGQWNVATVLHGLGDLQFGAPKFVAILPSMSDLTVADLDLDGVPDLLATSGGGLIARRMGVDGPVGPALMHPTEELIALGELVVRDFDGDSLPDVIAPSGLSFALGQVLNGLGPFIDLGHVLAGSAGTPTLNPFGTPQAGESFGVQVLWPQSALGLLFVGLQPANIPFAGGLFVPDVLVTIPLSQGSGSVLLSTWPADLPPGSTMYLQAWFKSGSGALSSTDAWLVVSE